MDIDSLNINFSTLTHEWLFNGLPLQVDKKANFLTQTPRKFIERTSIRSLPRLRLC
jgi:hypothetical protein